MAAKLMTEPHLQSAVVGLLQRCEPDLRVLQEQLTLGKYRLDVVAFDEAKKCLVVVELKTCAHISSLSQLLLYRSALRKATGGRRVDALLITTYLDREVVDVIKDLGRENDVRVKVCVGDGEEYDLKDPQDAGEQAWYQFDPDRHVGWKEQIAKWEGI